MDTAQASVERDIRKLQQDTAHGTVPVSALLRRALVLARAVADGEFESWLRKEIDGYDPKDRALPDYREVPCILNCWNPYRGFMPVQFVEPKDAKRWSSRGNIQAVEVLEGLVGDPRKAKTPLVMELPPEAAKALAERSNYPNPRYVQFVSSTSIDSILAAVRNRLLDWTLRTAPHGEGMSLKSMMTDTLSVTRGGNVLCKIKGRVDPVNAKVMTFDTDTPIQEGDVIVQHLPNGAEEKFEVLAPGFQSGHGRFPDSYQVSVERVSSRPKAAQVNHMDIQAKRFQFLAALHDAVEGDRHRIVNMFKIGESLGFDRKTTDLVVQFLTGESLVQFRALGGQIAITHHGVREVEDARSAPSASTEYFPPSGSVPVPPAPVTNIVHNYGSVGSIQQAGSGATQTISQDQRQQIAQVLGQLKSAMAGAKFDAATRGDIEAQVGTVEAQLKAANPPVGMIRGCLHALREILTSAAGQALGSALPDILKGLGSVLGI